VARVSEERADDCGHRPRVEVTTTCEFDNRQGVQRVQGELPWRRTHCPQKAREQYDHEKIADRRNNLKRFEAIVQKIGNCKKTLRERRINRANPGIIDPCPFIVTQPFEARVCGRG